MKHHHLPACILVTLSATLLSTFALPSPKKEPLILGKDFWANKTRQDTATIFLLSFDNDKESLDSSLGNLNEPESDGMSDMMMSAGPAQESIKQKSLGDAAPVSTGRFGGGLQLGGQGAIEIGPISWGNAFGPGRTVTIDAWFHPAPSSPRATLLDMPRKSGSSLLKVTYSPDGTVSLTDPAGRSVQHPRPVPPGTWTHIALIWPATDCPRLLVNGMPMAMPADSSAGMTNPLAYLAPKCFIGSDANRKDGFLGKLDEVRISSGSRPFYNQESTAFCDSKADRPITVGPPYFARTDKPILALSFDDTLTPEIFSGVSSAGKPSPNAFQPGIRGKAYDLSFAKKDGFRLHGSNLFPMDAGTIEFWMRPLTWDNFYIGDYIGSNVRSQMLLQFGKADYPEFRGLRAVHLRLGRGLQESATDSGFLPIHPGVWPHVLCVWNHGKNSIYLNGQLQPSTEIKLNSNYLYDQPDWDAYVKSGGLKNSPSLYGWSLIPSSTLIDEWRLYARPYNEAEAANAYARWFPDAANRLAALPPIKVAPSYDHYSNTLDLKYTCLPVNEIDPTTLHVTLKRAGKTTTYIFDGDLPLDANLRSSTNILHELPFGDYQIETTAISKDGKTLASKTTEYKRTQPTWWQNSLGKERTVPTPWTSIKTKDNSITVWGRTLTLAAGGLPTQIESAGTTMLATPLKLHGLENGKAIEFTGEPVTFSAKADDEMTWTSRLTAGSIEATVKGAIEYDGMMTFAVTLNSAASPAPGRAASPLAAGADLKTIDPLASTDSGAQGTARPTQTDQAPPQTHPTVVPAVEQLFIDIPIRPEVGSQLIVNGGGNTFRSAWDVRFIPNGQGRVWDSVTSKPSMQKAVTRGSFCPMVWIGDDERGLCFFGENDQGWTPGTNAPAQEIRRENGMVIYRMNVITKPVTLTQPRTLTFVIHPTPTKPLPDGWRAFNRGETNGPFANLEGIDACISPTLTAPTNAAVHLGMTFVMEPPSWEEAKVNGEILRTRAGKNSPRLFYMDYSWPKLGPSMADYRSGLWSRGRMLWTREVEDYMTWVISEYIKRDIIDGIYIDDVSFGANAVPFGTAYAMEDGTMQTGYNSLGFRRFLKRVRLLFLQAGKTPMIIPHMTYCFEIPALSFADVCVNGEDRDLYYPTQSTYPQAWGRDELRIQGSSAKWGFLTYWKNCINAEKVKPGPDIARWSYIQARALYALMTPSDLGVMWGNTARSVIDPSLLAYPLRSPDLKFIPPWKCGGIAEITSAQIPPENPDSGPSTPGQTNVLTTCLYAWKDRALMMISNLGPKEQVATVAITPSALFSGCQSVTFKDADTALTAPDIPVATRDEIKKAAKSMTVDLDAPDGKLDTTSAEDLLTGQKPAAKAAMRLTLKPVGNTLAAPIRPWDFRLIEIRPAP